MVLDEYMATCLSNVEIMRSVMVLVIIKLVVDLIETMTALSHVVGIRGKTCLLFEFFNTMSQALGPKTQ